MFAFINFERARSEDAINFIKIDKGKKNYKIANCVSKMKINVRKMKIDGYGK